MSVSTTRINRASGFHGEKHIRRQSPAAAIQEFISRTGPSAAVTGSRPAHVNATLGRAALKLLELDPHASELFASIIQKHDVREAWLGLAIAHHFQGESTQAGTALAYALSSHGISIVPTVANAIVQAMPVLGWCALDCAGTLTIQLVQAQRGRSGPKATLDDETLPLSADASGRNFTARLSNGWRRGRKCRVHVDNVDLLGSPIDLERITRVEGFADSRDGDLHGWAWCPNDPDYNPEVSIVPEGSGPSFTVVADSPIDIATTSALARPRAFCILEDQLRHFDGPVHVYGADGRDLTGSPLDPSAERRGAEAVSRIFAGLSFEPQSKFIMAPREAAFLSVAAHVIGGPIAAGSRKRPVDIVVPVHGALDLTLACLDSVLTDLPPWARVIVIDDASPDPQVALELQRLAASDHITLLTNPVNQGFPRSANTGMRQDTERDIVLLNSDTLVAPGCIASLRQAAYLARDIGSATPFSNDASILSYPSIKDPNAVPDLIETIRLNALAKRANSGSVVDIPTAVGFCVYIKRDCLNATGLLREDLFAQGYGEENDFSIRARHLGWRHVAVPSVFVAHVGGQSFGSAKHHLIERNMRKLNQLHPGYDALIREFQQADPLAEPRRRLDLALWETFRTGAQSVLLITHGRGGGVQRHVVERAAALRAEGLRPIVLWPAPARNGEGQDCILGNDAEDGTPNLRFSIPAELDMMTEILRADIPVRAEVHHMIGHDHELMGLFGHLNIPYKMVIHDYSWFCPRINLVAGGRYCNEPDVAGCEACIADFGSMNDEATPPGILRHRSAIAMHGATAVVVPSTDVATRIKRHFQSVRTTVVNWEDDDLLPPADPAPLDGDGIRRVCVIGRIGVEKGYEILLACARDIAARKLPLRINLVGYSCDDDRLTATGSVQITGQYEEHDAIRLIRQQRAQLGWLPAIWPETWSYTLTQAWQAGLNVFAFDIGAPAERIRRIERGWLCRVGSSPQALNDRMLALRPMETGKSPSLSVPRNTTAPSLWSPVRG